MLKVVSRGISPARTAWSMNPPFSRISKDGQRSKESKKNSLFVSVFGLFSMIFSGKLEVEAALPERFKPILPTKIKIRPFTAIRFSRIFSYFSWVEKFGFRYFEWKNFVILFEVENFEERLFSIYGHFAVTKFCRGFLDYWMLQKRLLGW